MPILKHLRRILDENDLQEIAKKIQSSVLNPESGKYWSKALSAEEVEKRVMIIKRLKPKRLASYLNSSAVSY